jgi:predicted branched-subunit amino acid permease
MKQWLIIIGASLFLLWYFPVALGDGKVTLIPELATIAINFLMIILNLVVYAEENTER